MLLCCIKAWGRWSIYSLLFSLSILTAVSARNEDDLLSFFDRLPPSKPRPIDEGFTMIIATYQRDEILHSLLVYLTRNPPHSLRHLVIVWQNVGVPLPEFLQPSGIKSLVAPILRDRINVVVRASKVNSMNERFRPLLDWDQEIPTEDVMIFDDDLVLPWTTIEWGYQRFLENQERIVGFTGRDYIAPHDKLLTGVDEEAENDPSEGSPIDYNAQPTRTYSMVLSNAAFMKKKWLEHYWQGTQEYRMLRNYVDEGEWGIRHILLRTGGVTFIRFRTPPSPVFNCDDILINFVVSNLTRRAPLLLKSQVPLRSIPSKGLWNRAFDDDDEEEPASTHGASERPKIDHFTQRALCLSHYFSVFSKYDTPASDFSRSTIPSYYPLLRCDYSISKKIEDEARTIKPMEQWDEPAWALDKRDWKQTAFEREENRRLAEALESMSEQEVQDWLHSLEDGEAGDTDGAAARGDADESVAAEVHDEL
ncbi:BZ3500_MvSof-1268-A1-R1_Chr6-2g08494 [Microbotryum saponariae]|uniref:BZ3500_MvSof-1268-A1-R1_Chr6-2g08494 protein n=1 Tax=Microbotryum saponariae TaxID=289078 RepID=A0A2X0MLP3_9BASI|nr:BZ3500_MvSof-1268-A1-R1_Chr6-2g08494 [Microbotryum saponariae]SDA07771.1 BZ3501_MvSof-1269-A2-R1_Chr6-1g08208 [Microbotryum saponariae]